MKILGIAGLAHNAAVTLIEDGVPVFAVEEERLLRRKHLWTFPFQALRYTLERTGTDPDAIDAVTFYFDTARYNFNSFFLSLGLLKRHSLSEFLRHQASRYGFAALARALPAHSIGLSFVGKRAPPIFYIEHHLSHLGGCYLPSGFEEAAVLIADSVGEYPCTSLYTAGGNRIKRFQTVYFPDSLGLVYTALTQYLGFHPYGDEYKTMGLAAHGERTARFRDFFRKLIRLEPDGTYRVDTRLVNFHLVQNITSTLHLSEAAHRELGPPRQPDEDLSQRHKDIAFALQDRLEEALLHMLRPFQKTTRQRNLCLAGGLALNCVANRRIFEGTDFQKIFIQPAASDAGASTGSALYYYHVMQGRPRNYVLDRDYLGPEFSDGEIERALENARLPYAVLPDPAAKAAELILQGKVLAWFQGRMEFGPRALGNRSILCDPRDPSVKEKLHQIKKREAFRPYAASVLLESLTDYFQWPHESPYMQVAVPVRPEQRQAIPALVHQDGTCRIQTVDRERNPLFRRLLEACRDRAGLPLVLNTSFNTGGEAMVCTPEDALRTFLSTPLDVLIMGKYLSEKPWCAQSVTTAEKRTAG
jgi:carbamoyltransferase